MELKVKVYHTFLWISSKCNFPVLSHQALAAQAAQQHYNMQLKKKVWSGWHSLVKKHWKVKVEQACQARAEEVCNRLSADYEAKLAEVTEHMRGIGDTTLWDFSFKQKKKHFFNTVCFFL